MIPKTLAYRTHLSIYVNNVSVICLNMPQYALICLNMPLPQYLGDDKLIFNTKMSQHRDLCSCVHEFQKGKQCLLCGVYQFRQEAIKSSLYMAPAHFNFQCYQSSLRKKAAQPVQSKELSSDTYILLSSICDKFLFGIETFALGLQIYQNLHNLHNQDRFWASACLIVASKAIELDKNVPYLSRYQRYADKSHTQQEYEEAERTIFEAMNFEIHQNTFITFLNFYLTCGFVFKTDPISHSLVQFLEDDVMIKAKELLRRGVFPNKEPQKLALSIIKAIRSKYTLQPWSANLEELTGYSSEQIEFPERGVLSESVQMSNYKPNETKSLIKFEGRFDKNPLSLNNISLGSLVAQEKSNQAKYSSISKLSVKENSYSISKPTIIPLRSKASQLSNFMSHYSHASMSSADLLNRRR